MFCRRTTAVSVESEEGTERKTYAGSEPDRVLVLAGRAGEDVGPVLLGHACASKRQPFRVAGRGREAGPTGELDFDAPVVLGAAVVAEDLRDLDGPDAAVRGPRVLRDEGDGLDEARDGLAGLVGDGVAVGTVEVDMLDVLEVEDGLLELDALEG